MSLADYREDTARWAEGSPIHLNEMCFYVRRWGTPESQKVVRDIRKALFGPLHQQQDTDEDEVLAEWLAQYGVTGWENVAAVDGGEQIKYTKKNLRGVFCNPDVYYSLNRILLNGALNFENYLHQEAKEDEEDLKKP